MHRSRFEPVIFRCSLPDDRCAAYWRGTMLLLHTPDWQHPRWSKDRPGRLAIRHLLKTYLVLLTNLRVKMELIRNSCCLCHSAYTRRDAVPLCCRPQRFSHIWHRRLLVGTQPYHSVTQISFAIDFQIGSRPTSTNKYIPIYQILAISECADLPTDRWTK